MQSQLLIGERLFSDYSTGGSVSGGHGADNAPVMSVES